MTKQILDDTVFKKFSSILKDRTSRHVGLLFDGCDALLVELGQGDVQAAHFSAHRLKSSSGQMGAVKLSSYMARLESDLDQQLQGDRNEVLQPSELLNELSALIIDTRQVLNTVLVDK